jgi:hypothetical protein
MKINIDASTESRVNANISLRNNEQFQQIMQEIARCNRGKLVENRNRKTLEDRWRGPRKSLCSVNGQEIYIQ